MSDMISAMRLRLTVALLFASFPGIGLGQSDLSMPSKSEIFELVDKADQKVSAFEVAVKSTKPYLDAIDVSLAKTSLEGAANAHQIIQTMHKNGPSAYGLVALLATMDDLSLNAANASVKLLSVRGQQDNVASWVLLLSTSGVACNDISELIMHATLRFVQAEEAILGKLLDKK
jgi:hypothetical protein